MGSATSKMMMCTGIAFFDIGLSLFMPTGLFRAANSVFQSAATFAISIFLTSQNVGLFLSPIIRNPLSHIFADGSAMSRYFIGAGGYTLLTLYGYMHVRKDQVPCTKL